MSQYKLLLFDLDGTLLQSNKTISPNTLKTLRECREKGMLIGVSTSRSEQNSMGFIKELAPDIVISSAGALVKYKDTYVYKAEFTGEEIAGMIQTAREICGRDCEITVDTVEEHYWNYKIDPKEQDKSWGDSTYTDFADFREPALKMCVEITNPFVAKALMQALPDCDGVRFSDGDWYKFTKKAATKEKAILHMCKACGLIIDEIISFGDDYADIGMLKLCGKGIAMGNAIEEVKAVADEVIGDNDHDGIANYLKGEFMREDNTLNKTLAERFEFRSIRPGEEDEAVTIEQICFPPHEACSEKHMKERIAKAPELFLVAVDKETGEIAGFLNGLSTNEASFRDEFFTDVNLYEPEGNKVMLLGLDVLPQYRRQGLAREIVRRYAEREEANGRKRLILTCLDEKVAMYQKMGFCDDGIANSTWGGEEWHQMSLVI